MIRSMTGFGSFRGEIGDYNITVEIKSVNHRYFEFSLRIPRSYSMFEDKLKQLVANKTDRGKVECSVQIESLTLDTSAASVNESLACSYFDAANALSDSLGIAGITSVSQLLCLPEVLTVTKQDIDKEAVLSALTQAVNTALDSFIEMREIEGQRLKQDILSRSAAILECVELVEERSPQTVREYTEKLLQKMRVAIGDTHVDEQRIVTEAAIFADKVAVAEETVRLRSHLSQLSDLLESGSAVGRKLDFLVQEINREANTIGSKAQDVEIARTVINIKAEVEKIREQIQNIE